MSNTGGVTNSPANVDALVDVIVIGGGAAGLMAAIEACDAGAHVILLESEGELGGSLSLSGGFVTLCETELQPGTKQELLNDLVEAHHYDDEPSLSQLYVNHAPFTYNRLKELGVEFHRVESFAHMKKPWAHELPKGELGGGAQIAAALVEAARQRDLDIRLGHRAGALMLDADGIVNGVRAQTNQRTVSLGARRGVVIASGGFTRNPQLIKWFGRPGTEKIIPVTGPGSRGDGLLMAMKQGAGLAYIGVGVAPTGPVEPKTQKPCLIVYAGAIMLNLEGYRFVDESKVYLDICWAGLRQKNGSMIQIYDQRIRDAYLTSMVGQVLFGGHEYCANTLEELLARLATEEGLDSATAQKTINDYNVAIVTDSDQDFGRRHSVGEGGIGSEDGALLPIKVGPFYAMMTVAGTTHFNGGLRIDDRTRVLDVFGSPIPRLFAAGEVTGGFHGAGYLSATFIGSAIIFGGIAGRNASSAE